MHGTARDVVDVVSAHRHGECLGPQSRAAAGRARAHGHERLDALLLQLGLRLAVAPLEVRDDALEGGHVRALAPVAVLVRHVHALAACAVQVQVLVLARELPPRPVERDFPAVGDRLEHLLEEARPGDVPGRQRAVADREDGVRHDQLRIHLERRSEPGAGRARAVWRVEGERARGELGQRDAVLRARELLRVRVHRAVDDAHLDQAVADAQRRLDRVVQPLPQVVLDDEPVDDGRDVVLVLLVERRHLLQEVGLTVHAHAGEALAAQALEHVAVLALAPSHERRVDREARALGQCQHLVDDLLGRLAGDWPPADGTVRTADAREQQAQIVVHLGDGADGRARVARRRLLVDRDRRRQALDRVDVRLVHLPQELARVGRERLDVAALPLGVERVERERRLAGSGQARDAHEGPARHADGDVAEVVLTRAVDDDFVVEKAVCGHRDIKVDQPSSGRSVEQMFVWYQGAGRSRRAAKPVF